MRNVLLSAALVLGASNVASSQTPKSDPNLDQNQRLIRLEQRLEQLAQQLEQARQREQQRHANPGPGNAAPGGLADGGPMGPGPMGAGPGGPGPMGAPPGGVGPVGGGFGFPGGPGFGQKPKPGAGQRPIGPGGTPPGPMGIGAGKPGLPPGAGGEGPEPTVHIFTLKNAHAQDMVHLLREVFGERHINLGVDVRTNSLVVLGDIHVVVEKIIQRLDTIEGDGPAKLDKRPFPSGEKLKKKFFDPDKKPSSFEPDKKPFKDFDKKNEAESELLQRLRANVALARAEFDAAARNAERAEQLARQGALSAAQLVNEQAILQAAREALRRAEGDLRAAEERSAPFDPK